MAFNADEIRANRDYFAHKLHSEKQRNDVLKAVEGKGSFNFVLLDTRGSEAFSQGHIPGAWAMAQDELDGKLSLLPKDKEIVTYCWGHD